MEILQKKLKFMNKVAMKKFLFSVFLLCCIACQRNEVDFKEVTQGVQEEVIKQVVKPFEPTKIEVSAEEIIANGTVMFTDADNEIKDGKMILQTEELRAFHTNKFLEIKAISGNKYQIRNFLPYSFKNLIVLLNVKGIDVPVKLGTVEEIPAFYSYQADLPLLEGEMFFENLNGEKVSLARLKKLPLTDFSLSFGGDDPMLAKINTIKTDVYYRFTEYNQPNKWDRVYANDARNYIPILCNFWYVLSSETFKDKLFNAPYALRHWWADENNRDGSKEENHQEITKEEVYNRIQQKRTQNLGIIVEPGLGGLGGGEAFGVRREYLTENYNNKKSVFYSTNLNFYHQLFDVFPMDAFVHEFGHVLGYGHTGNMTYYYKDKEYKDENSIRGFVPLFMNAYRELQGKKDLPFMEYPYKK